MTDRSVSLLTKYSEEPPNCALQQLPPKYLQKPVLQKEAYILQQLPPAGSYLDLRKGRPKMPKSKLLPEIRNDKTDKAHLIISVSMVFSSAWMSIIFLSFLVVAHRSSFVNITVRLQQSLLYPSCVSVPHQQDLSQKCDKAAYEAHILLWLLLLLLLLLNSRSLRF